MVRLDKIVSLFPMVVSLGHTLVRQVPGLFWLGRMLAITSSWVVTFGPRVVRFESLSGKVCPWLVNWVNVGSYHFGTY